MKKSIYVGPYLERVLERHGNVSGRLDIIACRYSEIVKYHCPILTVPQWCAIIDVLNGWFLSPSDDSSRDILHELEDGDELNGLGEKWSVNIPELREELKATGAAGLIAATEIGQQFWLTNSECKKQSYEEHLRHIGARIRPLMNTTEPTTIQSTFTCPETGVTIDAEGLADEYGSKNNTKSAWVRLIRYEGAENWILKGDDLYGGDATPESEWHKRDIVVGIWSGDAIVIDDDDLPRILSAAATACAYLHDLGEQHEIVWDGHRYVGQFANYEEGDFIDVESLSDLVAILEEISEQTVDVDD